MKIQKYLILLITVILGGALRQTNGFGASFRCRLDFLK
jgi:hypothetical protein